MARVGTNVPACSIPCRNRSPFQCTTSAPYQPASTIKPLMADAGSQRGNCGGNAERKHTAAAKQGRLCDSDNIKFQDTLDQLYLKLAAHRFIHEVIEISGSVIKAARRQAAYVSLIALQNAADSCFIALRGSMNHRKRKQSLISVTLRKVIPLNNSHKVVHIFQRGYIPVGFDIFKVLSGACWPHSCSFTRCFNSALVILIPPI